MIVVANFLGILKLLNGQSLQHSLLWYEAAVSAAAHSPPASVSLMDVTRTADGLLAGVSWLPAPATVSWLERTLAAQSNPSVLQRSEGHVSILWKTTVSIMVFQLRALECVFNKLVWSCAALALEESLEAASLGFSDLSPGFDELPISSVLLDPVSSTALLDSSQIHWDVGKDTKPLGLVWPLTAGFCWPWFGLQRCPPLDRWSPCPALPLHLFNRAFKNLNSSCSVSSVLYSVTLKSPCGNLSHLWKWVLISLKSQMLLMGSRSRSQDLGEMPCGQIHDLNFPARPELSSARNPELSAGCCSWTG